MIIHVIAIRNTTSDQNGHMWNLHEMCRNLHKMNRKNNDNKKIIWYNMHKKCCKCKKGVKRG